MGEPLLLPAAFIKIKQVIRNSEILIEFPINFLLKKMVFKILIKTLLVLLLEILNKVIMWLYQPVIIRTLLFPISSDQ